MPGSPAQTEAARRAATERRQFARRRGASSATIRTCDNLLQPGVLVSLVDFSYGGVCFTSPQAFELGQQVAVDLSARTLPPGSFTFEAIVRWVAPTQTDGHYRIGCAWLKRLSFAEIQQIR